MRFPSFLLVVTIGLLGGLIQGGTCRAQIVEHGDGALLENWESYPTRVFLNGSRDSQRLIVTGWDSAGNPRDWSGRAAWTSSNPSVAQCFDGEVFPQGDGHAEISARMGTQTIKIPVTVSGMDAPRPIQFENEVLVALSKHQCNSGACHGSPSGKGGFRLSLRAFDMPLDAYALTQEEQGRRVNTVQAEESLLLKKPLMQLPHGGGVQLNRRDRAYAILRDWIAQGAVADAPNPPRCVRLEVYPRDRVFQVDAGDQQLAVTAHLSDGTSRDVTSLVSYESLSVAVAQVTSQGMVRGQARGEAVILVRFLEHIESVPFLFVQDVPGFQWKSVSVNNFVDRLVDDKLRKLRYQPAELCSDEVFLRRVYLDVIGALPTIPESMGFLADTADDKRSRLIDQLLDRPEHAAYWALLWGDVLRITRKSLSDDGVYKYHRWVEQSIRGNQAYDQFVRELLSASGSTLANPPANFFRTAADTQDCIETISQVFLGARLQCAKCHNHPFERWTQDNYYGLGAFFEPVRRKKTQRPNELFIWSSGEAQLKNPRTGQLAKPWAPMVGSMEWALHSDQRQAFLDWLTRPDNPHLARVEANRIWSHLFARGIVDPIDDFRDSNPPTNRPLLDALATYFVESGFDRKALLRTILNSRTYQTTCESTPDNQSDHLYFSHQEPRLLGAESLLDALGQLTDLGQDLGKLPAGTKAIQIPAPDIAKVDFLKTFGQPERATVCACERSEDSNLAMVIELFSGSLIQEKLRDPKNRFRRQVAEGHSIQEVVRDLYLAGLCRLPTSQEIQDATRYCEATEDVASALEDLCWALINSDEFLFQH